jgi:gliding motility-associated-like protein
VLPNPVAFAGPSRSICSGQKTLVGSSSQVNPQYKYFWTTPPAQYFENPQSPFTNLTLNNNFGIVPQTVVAGLLVKDTVTGCSSFDTISITVKPVPKATLILPADTTECEGGRIRIHSNLSIYPTLNSSKFDFQWIRDGFPITVVSSDSSAYNATASGKFQVSMSFKGLECFDTSSAVSLRFYPNIKPRIVGDTNFCGSNPTLLRAVPANADFAYEWKLILPPDSSFTPPKIDTIILPGTPVAGVEVGQKGNLYVNMLTDKGCKAQSDIIGVGQLAQPIVVTDKRNAIFCDNDGFTFSTLDSVAFKYRWMDSANRNIILSEKSVFEPKVAGTYYLDVYNKCGAASDTFRVFQILPSPQFGILQNGKRDTTVCLNQPFIMQGPAGYLQYRWFIPKQVIDTATNELIYSADTISKGLACDSGLLVNAEQSYRLTLLIKDRFNCQNQDSIRIFVAQCPAQLFIPNAFLPIMNPKTEAESRNRLWFFDGFGIASVKWYIYNRWGEMVASGNNFGEPQNPTDGRGWDGTYKGELCPTGTYKYLIEYVGEKDNVVKKLAGNLTLIR